MVDKVNKNISVPHVYELFDKEGKHVREVTVETPDDQIVKLLHHDKKYYIAGGGWKLYEAMCYYV